jgi:hypothetical protein
MITNTGKSIIGKYLLGQAPAYASYIAVGCGAKPLDTGDPAGDYSTKENLDFEMFRVPISSRGFVNEDGVSKIVLTGELPTEERYEISEIGIYSAGSNPSAGLYDSKTLFGFASSDNWNRHTSDTVSEILMINTALDGANDNIISQTEPVFKTNADNSIFYKTPRPERYERCRFLNNVILMRGNEATLTKTDGHFVIGSGSNHIHLAGVNIDLSQNSPTDELRLAFSLINKDGASLTVPDTVRILVDFSSSDTTTGEYARFEAELINGTDPGEYDFTSSRYFVISKQLQELYTSANFTWDAVNVVKIYVSTLISGTASNNYYIGLDAMRLENIATVNPLYGLIGYSVVKTPDAETIIKSPNKSNYVEFRFVVDVIGA